MLNEATQKYIIEYKKIILLSIKNEPSIKCKKTAYYELIMIRNNPYFVLEFKSFSNTEIINISENFKN